MALLLIGSLHGATAMAAAADQQPFVTLTSLPLHSHKHLSGASNNQQNGEQILKIIRRRATQYGDSVPLWARGRASNRPQATDEVDEFAVNDLSDQLDRDDVEADEEYQRRLQRPPPQPQFATNMYQPNQRQLQQPFQHKNLKPVHVSISQQTVNGLLSLLLLFVIAICGCIGAIFIMSALTVIESLQTRGNCYLVSLSLAQLLVNLFVIPSSALQIMAGDGGLNQQTLCHYQWLTLEFSLIVSQLSFALIAADNYLGYCCSERVVTSVANFRRQQQQQQQQQQGISENVPELSGHGQQQQAEEANGNMRKHQASDIRQQGEREAQMSLQRDFLGQANEEAASRNVKSPCNQNNSSLWVVNSIRLLLGSGKQGKANALTPSQDAAGQLKYSDPATTTISTFNQQQQQSFQFQFPLPNNSGASYANTTTTTTTTSQQLRLNGARLARQFAIETPGAQLKQAGLLGYRQCCGRLRVLLWIVAIWSLAFAYTAYQHERSFTATFCAITSSHYNPILPSPRRPLQNRRGNNNNLQGSRSTQKVDQSSQTSSDELEGGLRRRREVLSFLNLDQIRSTGQRLSAGLTPVAVANPLDWAPPLFEGSGEATSHHAQSARAEVASSRQSSGGKRAEYGDKSRVGATRRRANRTSASNTNNGGDNNDAEVRHQSGGRAIEEAPPGRPIIQVRPADVDEMGRVERDGSGGARQGSAAAAEVGVASSGKLPSAPKTTTMLIDGSSPKPAKANGGNDETPSEVRKRVGARRIALAAAAETPLQLVWLPCASPVHHVPASSRQPLEWLGAQTSSGDGASSSRAADEITRRPLGARLAPCDKVAAARLKTGRPSSAESASDANAARQRRGEAAKWLRRRRGAPIRSGEQRMPLLPPPAMPLEERPDEHMAAQADKGEQTAAAETETTIALQIDQPRVAPIIVAVSNFKHERNNDNNNMMRCATSSCHRNSSFQMGGGAEQVERGETGASTWPQAHKVPTNDKQNDEKLPPHVTRAGPIAAAAANERRGERLAPVATYDALAKASLLAQKAGHDFISSAHLGGQVDKQRGGASTNGRGPRDAPTALRNSEQLESRVGGHQGRHSAAATYGAGRGAASWRETNELLMNNDDAAGLPMQIAARSAPAADQRAADEQPDQTTRTASSFEKALGPAGALDVDSSQSDLATERNYHRAMSASSPEHKQRSNQSTLVPSGQTSQPPPPKDLFWPMLLGFIVCPSLLSGLLFVGAYFKMKEFKMRPYKPMPVAALASTPPALLAPRSPIPLIAQRQVYAFDYRGLKQPTAASAAGKQPLIGELEFNQAMAPANKLVSPQMQLPEAARACGTATSGSSSSSTACDYKSDLDSGDEGEEAAAAIVASENATSVSLSDSSEDDGALLARAAQETARRISEATGELLASQAVAPTALSNRSPLARQRAIGAKQPTNAKSTGSMRRARAASARFKSKTIGDGVPILTAERGPAHAPRAQLNQVMSAPVSCAASEPPSLYAGDDAHQLFAGQQHASAQSSQREGGEALRRRALVQLNQHHLQQQQQATSFSAPPSATFQPGDERLSLVHQNNAAASVFTAREFSNYHQATVFEDRDQEFLAFHHEHQHQPAARHQCQRHSSPVSAYFENRLSCDNSARVAGANESGAPHLSRRQHHAQSFHYGTTVSHNQNLRPQAVWRSNNQTPSGAVVNEMFVSSSSATAQLHPAQATTNRVRVYHQSFTSHRLNQRLAAPIEQEALQQKPLIERNQSQLERHRSLPLARRSPKARLDEQQHLSSPSTGPVMTQQRREQQQQLDAQATTDAQSYASAMMSKALASVIKSVDDDDEEEKEAEQEEGVGVEGQGELGANQASCGSRARCQSAASTPSANRGRRRATGKPPNLSHVIASAIQGAGEQLAPNAIAPLIVEPRDMLVPKGANGGDGTCERKGAEASTASLASKVILCTYAHMTDDQLLKSNMLVFLVHSILWLPYVILVIVLQYRTTITTEFKDSVWWLAILNCCSCSYLYALTNKDFREAFNKLFYYCCCRSHVTFPRKTPIFRRQLDVDARGNLRVHIIPGLNVCSNKLFGSAPTTGSAIGTSGAPPVNSLASAATIDHLASHQRSQAHHHQTTAQSNAAFAR